MVVRHLGNTDFKVIMDCFLVAFENYFVKMPTDPNFYKQRWQAAGVRFNMSYGMFDGTQLVGFIINAVDERHGERIAYNSGTGVIPEYRGQGIVKAIYDYAIPDLIKKGITKCLLEVITENVKAISSYEGVGFKIEKHYKCFGGTISSESPDEFTLKELDFNAVDWDNIPNQTFYSWDNQTKTLEKGQYKHVEVYVDKGLVAFFSINPDNGYLVQFEILKQADSSWPTLFAAIALQRKEVRINNIDSSLISKIKAVECAGLKNTVDQYEMGLSLKNRNL